MVFLLLLCTQSSAFAVPDERMQVDITAEKQGVEVQWLHANIQEAAAMALPELWNRIIPQHAMDQIPEKIKAVRFLQNAVPNKQGVRIIFNKKRVLHYLKKNNIPYYAEQSSAELPSAEPLSDYTAAMSPGSDIQPGVQASIQAQLPSALLTVQRQASLPDQVLFEDDLARDPHVLSMILSRVNRGEQQYRLRLKSTNDLWLSEWFRRRGMILTQSMEGWMVRAQQ